MKSINKEPIWIDFGNADEDEAVRLFLPLKSVSLENIDLVLAKGQRLWITDGEIEAIGTTVFRDGIWVALLDEDSVKQVDKDAYYHIDNQK